MQPTSDSLHVHQGKIMKNENTETTQEDATDKSTVSGRVQRLVSFNFYDGGFWVRLFGVGVSVVNKERHLPLFSERNGHRKILRLGKCGFEFIS